ncbi:13518_t:CDS:2, partial [Gigaspora rosea]
TPKIQSITHKKITPSQFNVAAKKIIKQNKKEYSAEFVKLTTDISNVGTVSLSAATECTNKMIAFFTGETLDKKLSTGTLSRWNKEVSTKSLEQNRPRALQLPSYSYGVMADESTRGDKKSEQYNKPMATLAKMVDLNRCSGAIIAETVKKTCEENKLDPRQCEFWLTDNTAYMSGSKSGAVVEFNSLTNASSFRIPCGLHALQIALIAFEILYLWKVFIEWINNRKLNLQIKCMVQFGQFFHTKFFEFLTGIDNISRIPENNKSKCLPPEYRAHELPDQVSFWLSELQRAVINPYIIFEKELTEARSTLCDQEFTTLTHQIKLGLQKARDGFLKWMGCWTHLPLTICLLGGNNGPDFAQIRLDRENLLAIRKEKRSKIVNKAEIELGETAAKVILNELLKKK